MLIPLPVKDCTHADIRYRPQTNLQLQTATEYRL